MMGSASLLAFFAILCAFTSNAKPLDDPYEVKPYEVRFNKKINIDILKAHFSFLPTETCRDL